MSTATTAECAIVVDLYLKACGEMFEAYGLARTLRREDMGPEERSRLVYASVISATGDGIRLSSTVSMDAGLLESTHPSQRPPVPDREVQDWCREINNQLMGRIKNKLLRMGCEIANGLPVLVTGTNVSAVATPDIDHREYFFSSKSGTMTFTIEMLFASYFELDASRQAGDAHEIHLEGAMALF